MAKKAELKERQTGTVMYPVTTSECVYLEDGRTLKEWIEEINAKLP